MNINDNRRIYMIIMTRTVLTTLIASTIALSTLVGPATAGEDGGVRPRLVPGGLDIMQGDNRVEVVATQGLSLGTVSPLASSLIAPAPPALLPGAGNAVPMASEHLAMGGYVAYSYQSMALASAVRAKENIASADLSALYSGAVLGIPGTTALTLGRDLPRNGLFSLTPRALSQDPSIDPNPHGTSLSLSWNHAITPSLYFGGYASAMRITPAPEDFIQTPGATFRLGAGLGFKF